MTIAQLLQDAIQQQHAGRYADAERLYRQVLTVAPQHPDAWHLLGTLAMACGNLQIAMESIGRAISLKPAPEYYLNYGNVLLGLKKYEQAVAALQYAVAGKPDLPEAQYVLGQALKGLGELDEASIALKKAVSLRPAWADARNALAMILRAQGDLEGSAQSSRAAIRIEPGSVVLIRNLGVTLQAQRKFSESLAAFARVIELEPLVAENFINIGMAYLENGQIETAISSYRRAIILSPTNAAAHNNLGIALVQSGMMEDAIAAFRMAISIEPNLGDAYCNLGNVLRERGRTEEAIIVNSKAVAIDPDQALAHINLGAAYKEQGDLEMAMKSFRRALELNPDDSDIYNNIGLTLKDQGRIDEALAAFRKSIELSPVSAMAYNNLAVIKDTGRVDEAVSAIRKAVELDPMAGGIHSNLIFEINFHLDYDQKKIFDEALLWGKQRADSLFRPERTYANARSLERRLKVGYVSADFTYHPVGRFAWPFIEKHDRQLFEVHCFSNVTRMDQATNEFRQLADRWHDIRPLSDAVAAELIAANQIDILVDLALHTAGNRLLVFARQPAPIQISHLAYCGTSGMKAMDYVVADQYLLPAELEPFFTEKPIRLPGCYWCYRSLPDPPEPGPLPALSKGYVTFGCLNNFGKMSSSAFETWCELLRRIPNSRLLLHSKDGVHRQALKTRLAERGLDPQRLDFVGFVPLSEYLREYLPIDVGLDPFPFAGGTTTCDTLWMGVPVVSLAGRTTVSRGGLSILTNAGLPELVARSTEEYIQIAVDLASNLPRLSDLRKTMRQRLQDSELMDEKKYVRDLETAYRTVWRSWCGRQKSA